MNWFAPLLARALDTDEREAVLGDLAEQSRTGIRDVLGLVVRRQFQLLATWRPWAVLACVTLPFALYLSLLSRFAADGSAIMLWLYFGGNWDWNLLSIPMFRHDIVQFLGSIPLRFLNLVCWSWSLGLLLGRFSRKSLPAQAVFFCLALILGSFAAYGYAVGSGRLHGPNAEVFRVEFYRVYFPMIVLFFLGLLPAIAGMVHVPGVLRKAVWIAAILPVLMALIQGAMLWVAGPAFEPSVWRSPLVLVIPYWPVLYWIAITIQSQRRLRIA